MARIILVDDDPDILQLGRALLAQAGYEVLLASSAMEGLEHLERYGADAVITDINMPGHTGFDLARTVRAHRNWFALPIALLTARREKRDIERALELGVDDYILKPIDPVLFVKKVAQLLAKNVNTEKPQELDFAGANLTYRGQLASPIEVRSLSEIGLTVWSQQRFIEGSSVRLSTTLFNEIGCEPPATKVISSVAMPGRQGFETRLLFIAADESVLSKIRAWLYSHASKTRRAA